MSHSHMVIFQNQEGNPGYRQFEAIDEAVAFVESIRNDQGVDAARIFRLEEVHFQFQPYYRVSVTEPGLVSPQGSDAPSAPEAPPAPTQAATPSATVAAPEQPAAVVDAQPPTTEQPAVAPADQAPAAKDDSDDEPGSATSPGDEPAASEASGEASAEETAPAKAEPEPAASSSSSSSWGMAPPAPTGENGTSQPVGAGADGGTTRRGLFGR
ncbi:MAG: hypothetical protein R2754_18260 [Microthrixaceae bacterium]